MWTRLSCLHLLGLNPASQVVCRCIATGTQVFPSLQVQQEQARGYSLEANGGPRGRGLDLCAPLLEQQKWAQIYPDWALERLPACKPRIKDSP